MIQVNLQHDTQIISRVIARPMQSSGLFDRSIFDFNNNSYICKLKNDFKRMESSKFRNFSFVILFTSEGLIFSKIFLNISIKKYIFYNSLYCTYIHNFIKIKIIKLEEFSSNITSKRSNESLYKLFYQYLKWISETLFPLKKRHSFNQSHASINNIRRGGWTSSGSSSIKTVYAILHANSNVSIRKGRKKRRDTATT